MPSYDGNDFNNLLNNYIHDNVNCFNYKIMY